MSIPERTKNINAFKNVGPGAPRVLVISEIGITGLNLACANIMIIVVRVPNFALFLLLRVAFPRTLFGQAPRIANSLAEFGGDPNRSQYIYTGSSLRTRQTCFSTTYRSTRPQCSKHLPVQAPSPVCNILLRHRTPDTQCNREPLLRKWLGITANRRRRRVC
jgi:hypothetical protein